MMEPGFYNMDCMDAMREFPDGFFDLAVVDPPYGDGGGNIGGGRRFGGWFDRYKTEEPVRPALRPIQDGSGLSGGGITASGRMPANRGHLGGEIRQKNYCVGRGPRGRLLSGVVSRLTRTDYLGGNYFELPATRCFLIWDKCQSENFSMAMAEYAWTSFDGNAKIFRMVPWTTTKQGRFHPTQKPVQLYTWILDRYAKPGYKILDTHVGSASSLIACRRAGLEYWGYEIDAQYYAMAKARLDREAAQVNIMDIANARATEPQAEQVNMLDMFGG